MDTRLRMEPVERLTPFERIRLEAARMPAEECLKLRVLGTPFELSVPGRIVVLLADQLTRTPEDKKFCLDLVERIQGVREDMRASQPVAPPQEVRHRNRWLVDAAESTGTVSGAPSHQQCAAIIAEWPVGRVFDYIDVALARDPSKTREQVAADMKREYPDQKRTNNSAYGTALRENVRIAIQTLDHAGILITEDHSGPHGAVRFTVTSREAYDAQ